MSRDHWKVSVLGSSSSLLIVWPSVYVWPQFLFLCQTSSYCSDFACYLNFWKNKLWLMYPFTFSLQLTVVNSKNPSPMCRQAVYHLQSSNRKQHWCVWCEWRQGNGSVELFHEECWCSMISFVCIQSLSPGPAFASLWACDRSNPCSWLWAFLASCSQADHFPSVHKHLSPNAVIRPCSCADSSCLQICLHPACLRWQQVASCDVWRVSALCLVIIYWSFFHADNE